MDMTKQEAEVPVFEFLSIPCHTQAVERSTLRHQLQSVTSSKGMATYEQNFDPEQKCHALVQRRILCRRCVVHVLS